MVFKFNTVEKNCASRFALTLDDYGKVANFAQSDKKDGLEDGTKSAKISKRRQNSKINLKK